MDKLQYESNVKNKLLDPVLDVKNQRTEFRINDDGTGRVILSSMRLVGLGVFAANNVSYLAAGAAGVIKNIYLYDGNQVLDQCLEANGWMAFTNYLEVNDKNASKDKWLMRHNMGFKNLRLVIEYDNEITKLIDKNNETTTTARPILSYDEVVDAEEKAAISKAFKGVSWDSIEHDRVFVAANAAAGGANVRTTQNVNANVKNYRGKYLKKIVVQKKAVDEAVFVETNDVSPMGGYNSVTCINEKLNFKVNGAPKLPIDMDKPGKRLGLLNETWGICNSYPLNADFGNAVGAATVAAPSGPRNYFILGKFNETSRASQVGLQDYFGLEIEDDIREMEINFSRDNEGTAVAATNQRYNSGLELHMWGLCNKNILVSNGKYSVSY